MGTDCCVLKNTDLFEGYEILWCFGDVILIMLVYFLVYTITFRKLFALKGDEERRANTLTRKAKLKILYWSASLGNKYILIFECYLHLTLNKLKQWSQY